MLPPPPMQLLLWFSFGAFVFRWGKRASHNRAQIVLYLAENLELRRQEFIGRLISMTGCTEEVAKQEVDLSIQRLFHWGAYADKYGGTVQVGGWVGGGGWIWINVGFSFAFLAHSVFFEILVLAFPSDVVLSMISLFTLHLFCITYVSCLIM